MNDNNQNFDLIVIGSGPGGYVAAIRASQLGMKVAIVEKEHLGGICLNWGCIPTKALLRSSEIHHLLHNLDEYGFSAKEISFDFKKVIERSRKVANQLSSGIGFLMKKHNVTVFDGYGLLNGKSDNGKHQILVRGDADPSSQKIANISAKNVILATGARARSIPGMEADGKQIWSYKEALNPPKMPKNLLVIGSGAIGSEFASFYHNMGSKVTLVELMDRILPAEDEEISEIVRKSFENQGINIKTETSVAALDRKGTTISAILKDKDGKEKTEKFDTVIVAVGVVGNTENLGLQGSAVRVENNQIQIDSYGATDEDGIYAIGDVAGGPWLAHKASHEAVICAEYIAHKNGDKSVSKPHPINRKNIPGCTYCMPQVASVGLSEKKAKDAGYDIKVGRFPYIGNGKAIALGEPEGLVKTIFDKATGELLGAHMVGAEVTEMLSTFLIGKQMEAVEHDFAHTIFPHPTLSEMMHEAVLAADGEALHI